MNWLRTLLRFPFPTPTGRWLLPALLLLAWGGQICAAQSSLGISIMVTINLPPVDLQPPTITGIPAQDMMLSCDTGTWHDPEGDPLTFTYQWRRAVDGAGTGAADISGATGASYLLTAADADSYVTCRITARDPAGNQVPADAAWCGPVVGDQTLAQHLWIISDPPLETQVGDALAWTVLVDASALTVPPDLHFALLDAPTGMTLTPDAAGTSATVAWPAVTGSPGYLLFRLLVWDGHGGGSHIQEITLLVQPPATGIAARSDGRWRLHAGVMAALCITAIGLILGGVLLTSVPSAGRTAAPCPRPARRRRRRPPLAADPPGEDDP